MITKAHTCHVGSHMVAQHQTGNAIKEEMGGYTTAPSKQAHHHSLNETDEDNVMESPVIKGGKAAIHGRKKTSRRQRAGTS